MERRTELVNVQIIDDATNCWFVRSESGKLYHEYTQNEYISLGWNYLTKEKLLNLNHSEENIRDVLLDQYNENQKQLTKVINKCKMFALEIKKGDYVIIPNGGSTFYTIGIIDRYFEGDKNDLFEAQDKDERVLLPTDLKLRKISEELSDVKAMKESYEEDIIDSPYLKRWTFKTVEILPWKSIHPTLFISLRSPNSIMNLEENRDLFFASIYPIFQLNSNLHFNFNVRKSGDISASDINEFTYSITKLFETELDLSEHALIQKISVSSSGPVIYTIQNLATNPEIWSSGVKLFGVLLIALMGFKFNGKIPTGELALETPKLLEHMPDVLDSVNKFQMESLEVEMKKLNLAKEKHAFESQKKQESKKEIDELQAKRVRDEMEKQEKLSEALSIVKSAGMVVVPSSNTSYIETIVEKAKNLDIDTERNNKVISIKKYIGSDNDEGDFKN